MVRDVEAPASSEEEGSFGLHEPWFGRDYLAAEAASSRRGQSALKNG